MLPRRLLSIQSALVLCLFGILLITLGFLCLKSSFLTPGQVQFIQSNYHSSVLSDQNNGEGNGIDLNKATEVELETLPLVGPATAKKIIQARPYQTTNELIERKIVSEKVFKAIESKIKI